MLRSETDGRHLSRPLIPLVAATCRPDLTGLPRQRKIPAANLLRQTASFEFAKSAAELSRLTDLLPQVAVCKITFGRVQNILRRKNIPLKTVHHAQSALSSVAKSVRDLG